MESVWKKKSLDLRLYLITQVKYIVECVYTLNELSVALVK